MIFLWKYIILTLVWSRTNYLITWRPPMVKSASLVNSYDFWMFLAKAMIEEMAYSAMDEGE